MNRKKYNVADLDAGTGSKGSFKWTEPKNNLKNNMMSPNKESFVLPVLGSEEETEVDDLARGKWGKNLEFLMSCISMSVGLGNVWRFPTVAYENGGGAFLIPYLIVLIIIGRPLYYMELVMGQFSGAGAIKFWKCVPALKGIGYAQMVSSFYIMVFYNYLMALTVFFLFASMQGTLPWTICDPDWADNRTCPNLNLTDGPIEGASLSEQYFNNYVINKSSGLDDMTSLDWRLALCLLMAWTFVFLSVIKGIESLGKVSYFTAMFPYTILIALLVVALLNDGAVDGIKYLFTPQWEKLLDPVVWYRACQQSFFSLAVGYGALIMYSSYNDFRHNVAQDALIISITDTCTSLLAGCVIFSVLGTLSKKTGQPIKNVIRGGGNGLAFIAYPEALGNIPYVPQLWSILFFFMLFTLGIGSSVAQLETVLTPIRDRFPALRKRKWMLALTFCFLAFITGLTLVTDAGEYVMLLLDNYGVGTAVFLYGILETVGVMWIYGIGNFGRDIQFMLGGAPNIFWKVTWGAITPLGLIVIFIYGNISDDHRARPGVPTWGTGLGWAFAGFALIQIPLWAMVETLSQRHLGFLAAIKKAFSPNEKWGPRNPKLHAEWLKAKADWLQGRADQGLPPPYDNLAFEGQKEGQDDRERY